MPSRGSDAILGKNLFQEVASSRKQNILRRYEKHGIGGGPVP